MTTTLAPDNRVGHPAEDLLRASMSEGQQTLHRLSREALGRHLKLAATGIHFGEFFDANETRELAETFAAVLGTADLLGRALIREREQQVLLQRGHAKESASVPQRQQGTKYSCGAAAFAAVLARYGIAKTEEELAAALGTDSREGTSPASIVDAANRMGLRAEEGRDLTIGDLAHSTGKGVPVLCNVQMHGGGHWVVVTKADPKHGTIYLDPNDGNYHRMDSEAWMRIWWDKRDGQRINRCGIAVAPRGYQSPRRESIQTEQTSLLDVPDIRQPNRYSCGAAASMCVAKYFGVGPNTIGQWMTELGTTVERSTHPFRIEAYLRQLGLQVEARENMTVEDLARYTRRGWPVITPVQDYGLQVPDGADFEYGHYLTVIGVGMGGYVFCQDSSLENLELEPGGDVPKKKAEPSGNISEPGRILVNVAKWDVVWHDEDIHGRKFIHYGIAVGPPAQKESIRTDEIADKTGRKRNNRVQNTLLREAIAFTFIKPMAPIQAFSFFRSLLPRLGVDPLRWGANLRRRAFTLAVATGQEMLTRVQKILSDRLASGERISAAPLEVEKTLDMMGAGPMPEGYGETVVRTNMMDAFNEGMQHELNQVKDTFPVYMYSNPDDSRSRPWHAEKNGKYYPSSVPFAEVRGTDAADVCNCRCVSIPQDRFTWAEKKAGGARIANGYIDPTD